MTRTVKTVIRKDVDGMYQLITNVCPDFLCVMNQEEFEALIKQLERLRDNKLFPNDVVYFPEFTYQITG